MITTADFFSGLGGFSQGAALAGLAPRFAANHWEVAIDWHRRNHPEAQHVCQDLQQLDMRLLPDLSGGILLAGPACQGHSQNSQPARKGRGGSHNPDLVKAQERTILQRSTAWAVVAGAEVARPRAIIVENVPDFFRWELFGIWRQALEQLGYHVRQHVVHADRYGSAQARQRGITTACLSGPIDLADEWGDGPGARSLGDCLDLGESDGHRWSVIADKSDRMLTRMRKAQGEAGSPCVWNNVSESSGKAMSDRSPTLTTKSGSQLYLLDGERARILNPRELARIQGFPDTYKIPKQRGLAGHLIGNAIDVRIAHGVCEQVAQHLS